MSSQLNALPTSHQLSSSSTSSTAVEQLEGPPAFLDLADSVRTLGGPSLLESFTDDAGPPTSFAFHAALTCIYLNFGTLPKSPHNDQAARLSSNLPDINAVSDPTRSPRTNETLTERRSFFPFSDFPFPTPRLSL